MQMRDLKREQSGRNFQVPSKLESLVQGIL